MNILYLKYAVEIGKTGSINKAAENLFMAQPNLSRAIKELENSLGMAIFERTSKGMLPTADGERFLTYAEKILRQVDEVENIFSGKNIVKNTFSLSAPRAGYIARAFTKFAKGENLDGEGEIFYDETNALRAINNIIHEDYKLAVIRYCVNDEKYFTDMLHDKQLTGELIATFSMQVVMSKNHPLANKEVVSVRDFEQYIQVAYADAYIPTLSQEEARTRSLYDGVKRRLFVSGRAAMFDIISTNSEAFARCTTLPGEVLEKFDLVQKKCEGDSQIYKDLLVYRKGYHLSTLDKAFITELIAERRKYIN